MSARGLVSIDVLVELSIVALSQVSIDVVEVVSIDVVKVVSINDAHFSLRIEHSKRVGSEKKSNSSLLLLMSRSSLSCRLLTWSEHQSMLWPERRSMLPQTSINDLID
ncbi:hypothetical protein F2Q69_00030572 [Brassica cretica]|uniref:Secreted protein n=1 Tax=Brassica cretica TaxID=69181 RepID=A0A8S9RZC0_BRACR|nr:hypothetical protein F2Q69_00030572 [Brassica cretica]